MLPLSARTSEFFLDIQVNLEVFTMQAVRLCLVGWICMDGMGPSMDV
jgi:hypothetical protein